MKHFGWIIVLLGTIGFSQAARYDSVALNPRGAPIPNATITLCTGTATGTPCSPAALGYTDITTGVSCASGFPVVQQSGGGCTNTTDGNGNFGFWLIPGAYKYSISGPNVATPQTYTITVPVGATPLGAANINGALTVNGTAGVTTNAINGVFYVDGCAANPPASPRFACTAAGIQAAINAAALVSPAAVIIPPGTVAMGSTGLTFSSVDNNVCLYGSGMNATTLRFTGAPALAAIFFGSGVQNACVGNLTLSFATATNGATGLRVGDSTQATAIEFNTFRDILITWDSINTTGTAAIWVNGKSGTATALNHFENIVMSQPVQCLLANLAEGNTYYFDCSNAGGTGNSVSLVSETGSNDERFNIRVESGTPNGSSDICFANTASGGSGYGHLVTMTCDLGNAGTAINETGAGGGYSYYDISTINTNIAAPTLGTVSPTSQYRFVSKGNATTTAQTPNLVLPGSTSGSVTVVAPATAGSNTATVPANTGTIAELNLAQSWTAAQTLGSGGSLNASNLLISPTAPSILAAGCGGSAAAIVAAPNGPAAFAVNVGSTPGNNCAFTLPSAANAWNCYATDITTQSTSIFLQKQTATSQTTATITNFNTAGTATAFTASDILQVSCFAR